MSEVTKVTIINDKGKLKASATVEFDLGLIVQKTSETKEDGSVVTNVPLRAHTESMVEIYEDLIHQKEKEGDVEKLKNLLHQYFSFKLLNSIGVEVTPLTKEDGVLNGLKDDIKVEYKHK